MAYKDCFAYHGGKCVTLKVEQCHGEPCAFKKSKGQNDKEMKKCLERIKTLGEDQKRKITKQYYNGKKHLLYDREV